MDETNSREFEAEEMAFDKLKIEQFLSNHTHQTIIIYLATIGKGVVWSLVTIQFNDGKWVWQHDGHLSYHPIVSYTLSSALPLHEIPMDLKSFLFKIFHRVLQFVDKLAVVNQYDSQTVVLKACYDHQMDLNDENSLPFTYTIQRADLWVCKECETILDGESPLTGEECYFLPKKLEYLMKRCNEESKVENDISKFEYCPEKWNYRYVMLYQCLRTLLRVFHRAEKNEAFQLKCITRLHLQEMKKQYGNMVKD